MTYEEALDIVEKNNVCPKHCEPLRNYQLWSGTTTWTCDECSAENLVRANEEYRQKQERIKEAARIVYGVPKETRRKQSEVLAPWSWMWNWLTRK